MAIAQEMMIVDTNRQKTERTGNVGSADVVQAVQAEPRSERRQFLRLVRIVGVAAMITGWGALSGIGDALTGRSSGEKVSTDVLTQGSPQEASTQSDATTGATFSPCVACCPRGCSYPGSCRRYTDANRSGRCDLGECA